MKTPMCGEIGSDRIRKTFQDEMDPLEILFRDHVHYQKRKKWKLRKNEVVRIFSFLDDYIEIFFF